MVVLCLCRSGQASEKLDELGSFEREAVDIAMVRLALSYDAAPAGKRIRNVHVVNLPVFTERAGFLQWFNAFHSTTQEHIIRRELLVTTGDLWDDALIAESKRNLADPRYSGLVALVPVRTGSETQVDLLVVTRDVWSLRFDTRYEFQGNRLTLLTLSPSENNLFGLRKSALFEFTMDQGRFTVGPQYLDKNLFGKRLELSLRAAAHIGRESDAIEGSIFKASAGLPLWSLQREWGWSATVGHTVSRERSFQAEGVRTFDDPATEQVEAIPWQYDLKTAEATFGGTRSFGRNAKHNVTLGYGYSLTRASLAQGVSYGDAEDAFVKTVLPRSERASGPFLGYSFFLADFAIYRDFYTYELAENFRLGPEITLKLSLSPEAFGSTRDFAIGTGLMAYTWDIAGDGIVKLSMNGETRRQNSDFIDTELTGKFLFIAPRIGGVVRPVVGASYGTRLNEQNNRFFTIGGESGLRGFEIAEFDGLVRAQSNVELRTVSVPLGFVSGGMLLFWDAGHAADRWQELSLRHDIGFGLRVLVPEAQPTVFRFDYAFPMNDRAALPGRFTAGFGQVF